MAPYSVTLCRCFTAAKPEGSYHELMQCASSTANKVRCPFELMAFNVPMKPSVLSSSGVMKRRRMAGAADFMSCRTLARSWAVLVDDRKSHLMLFFLRLATWFSMRAEKIPKRFPQPFFVQGITAKQGSELPRVQVMQAVKCGMHPAEYAVRQ